MERHLILMASKDEVRVAKRRLFLHDSFVFLGLTLISIALFLVTLFLFRSFSSHRVELAKRWYARGVKDLAANHPEQAVASLRAALDYAPGDHDYQLLLAEALGQAGDTDEAEAYFLNLWETEPGSGPLNLQLARLATRKGHDADAIRSYRAAIYGTWEGDGSLRRREVRLELVRYLMSKQDLATAQSELLIAAGNAPDDPAIKGGIADLMMQAGDFGSALVQYEKILVGDPKNLNALQRAGEAAYRLGHYASAVEFLTKAAGERERASLAASGSASDEMLRQARRILELDPARDISNSERVSRILYVRQLAQDRWKACQVQLAGMGPLPAAMQELDRRWADDNPKSIKDSLLRDPSRQQTEIGLAYDTEMLTSQVCGAPRGDDALVLLIAKSPAAMGQ
jgi:tetratricopeptide (TPR) repeat protein